MSRLGKLPVSIPEGVEASLKDAVFLAKGKMGSNQVTVLAGVSAKLENKQVIVTPNDNSKRTKIAWGTTRQLIKNAVIDAANGYTRKLELNGVGFRVQMQGKNLKMSLGFSHDVIFPVPDDLKIKVEGEKGNVIVITGANREAVGLCASKIRGIRKPEPYKGKGIKYMEETILRKEGKKK